LQIEQRALSDRDVLVGVAGGDAMSARSLFPGRNIVTLPMDSAGSLLRPAVAWEVLDAVLLSAAAAAQLTDEQIQTLLSAGTMIVVRSSEMPDSRWPWTREGNDFILRHEITGPIAVEDEAVYEPTNWRDPGWPPSFRHSLLAGACVFCIVGLGISLWRSRLAVPAFVSLAATASLAVVAVYLWHSPVQVEKFCVAVRAPEVIQFDFWSWQTTVREADSERPAPEITHPIFGAPSQLEQTQVRLNCGSDGRPDRFVFHLKPGQSLAMLTRVVRPRTQLNSLSPPDTKWRGFIQANYLRPSDVIAGQALVQDPSTGEAVATILIDRR
jgi:hypothetical protein